MFILALESSAKPASAAVYKVPGGQDTKVPGEKNTEEKLLGLYFQNNGFSHSRTLMAMVESLLKNLDLKPADIGLIAVANGPGSFTGVRIGVSAAKGLASGLDIPVCGVSTLEAMAYQTGAQSSSCIICPVMDARRQQVYNALFEWKNGAPVRIKDDRAISLEDLAAELLTLNSQASALNLLLVGDGAAITQDYLTQKTDIPVSTAPELQRYQTAYGVTLAALHKEPVAAAVLEPNYLRPSQAERERNKP